MRLRKYRRWRVSEGVRGAGATATRKSARIPFNISSLVLVGFAAISALADEATPILIESVHIAWDTYEQPPTFASSDLLPAQVVCGPYHEISDLVVNDGFMNHYTIDSDFGRYETVGEKMTRTRVREINAIGTLRELRRSEAMRDGFGQRAKALIFSPVRQLKYVAKNPLHLVVVVPSAIVKPIGYIIQGREILTYGPSARLAKEYIGFSGVKRDLARELGVDPESDDAELQAELNRATWAHFGGEVPIRIAENFVPGIPMPYFDLVGDGESVLEGMDTASSVLEHKSKRTMLWRMGLEHADLKVFLDHEHFTDRQKRTVVGALYAMDLASGREAVVLLANAIDTTEAARALMQQLQMMAHYDRDIERIELMFVHNGRVIYYTESDVILAPLFGEYLTWTPEVARIATALPTAYPHDLPVSRREVWLAGGATSRFNDECTKLDFAVHPNATAILASMDARDRVEFSRRPSSEVPILVPHDWKDSSRSVRLAAQ